MAGTQTQTAATAKAAAGKEGREASAATASSAVKKPVASSARPKTAEIATREHAQTGNPIDDATAADIFRELGGKPEPVDSDTETDETDATAAEGSEDSGAPEETATDEETAGADGAEQETETTTEADGETDDDAKAEGADEAAADAEESEEAPDAVPKWAEKRFAEMTRQIKDRDREITALKQGAPAGAPRPAPLGLEAEILQAHTPEQLGQLRTRIEELEDLALANPEGLEVPGKKDGDEPVVYSREQMAQLRINARRALRMLPQRAEQIKVGQQYERAAHDAYHGFDDQDSEESKSANYLLQLVPELRRYPAWKQLIGDALVTERARIAKAKQAGDGKKTLSGKPLPGKPVAKPAAKPNAGAGKPARAPATPTPKAAQLAQARTRAGKSGSEADVAALLELTLG